MTGEHVPQPGDAVRFGLFDSLRAIAALSLLLFHAAVPAGLVYNGSVNRFTSRLDVGVVLFFLISGFLLYRPFALARYHGHRVPPVLAYAWRRLIRIVPAYWVVLTITALVFHEHVLLTLKGIVSYYGFAHIYTYGEGFLGIGQVWSLGIEMSFYVFLPLLAFALRTVPCRTAGRWLASELGVLACVFGLSWLYKIGLVVHHGADALFIGGDPGAVTGIRLHWLLVYLDEFALGMALAVATIWWREHGRPLPRMIQPLNARPGLAWAAATVLYVLTATAVGLRGGIATVDGGHWLIRHGMMSLVALAIILPATVGEEHRGLVRRFLGQRWLLWLGVISYGIYLYQDPLIRWLTEHRAWPTTSQPGWEWFAWLLTVLAGTVALAAASWFVVERPALRLRRLVGAQRAVGGAAAAAQEPPH